MIMGAEKNLMWARRFVVVVVAATGNSKRELPHNSVFRAENSISWPVFGCRIKWQILIRARARVVHPCAYKA